MSRRLLFLFSFVIAVPLACTENQPLAQPRNTENSPPIAATQPAPSSDPQSLADKTAAFAQAIQSSTNRRPPATQVAQPAPLPVAIAFVERPVQPISLPNIDWLDKSVNLSLGPRQHEDPAGNAAAIARPAAAEIQSQPPSVRDTPPAEALEQKLAAALKSDPRALAAHLDFQLFQFISGNTVPRLDALASLPADDREIISAILDALVNLRSTAKSADALAPSVKMKPLIALADRLAVQSSLRIPTVALCTRVAGFGSYDPLAAGRLVAGREQTVILYCEVENFSTKLNERGFWETNLTQESALYDDRGRRVWEDKRQPVSDLSRNRRRDFYVNRLIKLPATLPAGTYSLKVTITDGQSNRLAQSTVSVVIGEK